MRSNHTCTFTFILLAAVTRARADWPEFRGPFGNGHVAAPGDSETVGLPLTWSEDKNIRWKIPISHRGWSTPVVLDGQIWLTTATEDGRDFFVLAIDANTGKVLHNKKLFHSDNPEPLGNAVNCYATPSPAIEPGRVYVHFGSYGTACLDTANGEVIWSRDDLPCRHYRGPSSSLVLFKDMLILTMDGIDLQYVAALNKTTGNTVWSTDRNPAWKTDLAGLPVEEAVEIGDHRKAHSTPLIVTTSDGRPQMLSGGAEAAYSYDPHNGRELWRIEFDGFSVAPRPLYEDGIAYLVTGIINPQLWAIRTDGRGNLTATDYVLWKVKKGVTKTASPILVDGLIYMINDEGVINCVDAANGDAVWTKRLAGKFASSPIYADDRIYFSDQDGATTVIRPARRYKPLATNTLDSGCMASPAVDGRALILRTKTHLYRIEEK